MRWLRRLVLAGLAMFVLTALAVVVAALAMQHRHAGGRSLDGPVDAAIVLGAGVDPDLVLGYSSRRRVAAGVALLRAGLAGRLIVSGGGLEDGPAAAGLMRDHALSLGAPANAVLVEEDARTTFENIRFSFAIARAAGLDRLAVVTDDYHLARASWLACYFGDCAIGTVAAPVIVRGASRNVVMDIGREALAWWYNLGKVTAWSVLGAAGAEGAREALVH